MMPDVRECGCVKNCTGDTIVYCPSHRQVDDEAGRTQEADAATAKALDEMEEDVTEWEAEFLTSIREQLARGQALSPKQGAVLDRIAEEHL